MIQKAADTPITQTGLLKQSGHLLLVSLPSYEDIMKYCLEHQQETFQSMGLTILVQWKWIPTTYEKLMLLSPQDNGSLSSPNTDSPRRPLFSSTIFLRSFV